MIPAKEWVLANMSVQKICRCTFAHKHDQHNLCLERCSTTGGNLKVGSVVETIGIQFFQILHRPKWDAAPNMLLNPNHRAGPQGEQAVAMINANDSDFIHELAWVTDENQER